MLFLDINYFIIRTDYHIEIIHNINVLILPILNQGGIFIPHTHIPVRVCDEEF